MKKLYIIIVLFMLGSCIKKQELSYPFISDNYFENEDLIFESSTLSHDELLKMNRSNPLAESNEIISNSQHLVLKLKPKADLLKKIKADNLKNTVFEENLKNTISFGLQKYIKITMESSEISYTPVLYFMENASYVESSYLIFLRFDISEKSNSQNWFLEIEPNIINKEKIRFPIQLINS